MKSRNDLHKIATDTRIVTCGEPARKQTRAGIGGPLLRKTITLTSVLAAHLSDLLVLLVDLSLHPLELPEPCSNLPMTAMALRHSGVVVLVVVPPEGITRARIPRAKTRTKVKDAR